MLQFREFLPSESISVDSSAELQQMIDQAFADGVTDLKLEPRRWRIDNGITFPHVLASEVRTFVIDGEGSIFDFSNAAAGQTLFGRIAADIDDSDNKLWNPTFKNIVAFGSGTQHFIRWHISSQANFQDCKFQNFDIGIENLFGLQCDHVRCNATNVERPFRAISGEALPSGNNSNSNSNLANYYKCRANMSSATAVGFHLHHVGQSHFHQCVIEGSQCDIGIHLLGETSGTYSAGRDSTIVQPWFECSSFNTAVRILLDKSNVTLDQMRIQGNQDTGLAGAFIDAKSSRRCHIKIANTRWEELVGTSGDFYADDQSTSSFYNQWTFRDNTINGSNTLTTDDKWAGGSRPPLPPEETGTFQYG